MNMIEGHQYHHGKIITCTGGYKAFIPASPPPPIEWNNNLVVALSSADIAIGQLVGEYRRQPTPSALIGPFIRREAILSSRIEGTRTTLGEFFASEASPSKKPKSDDLQEVINYIRAMQYGLDRMNKLPLSLRFIREIHEILMDGVRGERASPGEFRRSQNWVGPPGSTLKTASYIPPPPEEMLECLYALERYIYDDTLPPLVHTAIIHAQFELIHPFVDGNGRVGRLLILLMLVHSGVLPSPILYLSAYFERTRDEYYSHLLALSSSGEWEKWLIYYLQGVQAESEDVLNRIHRLDNLLNSWANNLADKQTALLNEVLKLFIERPFWSAVDISDRLDIAYTTARRALHRLEDHDVVSFDKSTKRNRIYFAREALDVMNEPINYGEF